MASETPTKQMFPRGVYRGILPSWFFSIWFHLALLVLAAIGLRSCTGHGQGGEADTQWQTVGLVMRMNASPARQPNQSTATQSQATPKSESSQAIDAKLSQSAPPTVATDPIKMPENTFLNSSAGELAQVIGPGSAVPKFSDTNPSQSDPGRVATAPIAPAGLAAGQTDFFGIRSSADNIVYVIDISGSMANPTSAIHSAKRELLASLATLDNEQRFQVIFFNSRLQMMRISGEPPGRMIPATDINRTLASQEIAAVRPKGGTDPIPALERALALEPDVIYFLTDAQKGALSAGDLERITRANDGEVRIHSIEFGKGDRLAESSVMERLARQNGGAFEYHDVTGRKR